MADRFAQDLPGWISPASYKPSRERLVDMVEEYPGDPERIVDVGCGTGELAAALASRYDADIYAVDISPESCREADRRTAAYPNAGVICADANRAPWNAASFDIAFAANSLQDTEDPAETLKNLYGWLRDGGELVATLPGESGMSQMPDAWFDHETLHLAGEQAEVVYMDPGVEAADGYFWGQYVFPGEEAKTLFEATGFSVEEEETMTADANGIVSVGRILGDRRMKWGGWLLNKIQQVHDGIGPEVNMYRLRR